MTSTPPICTPTFIPWVRRCPPAGNRGATGIFFVLSREKTERTGAHTLSRAVFGDLVATPLLHDTPDEIAQSEVRDWTKDECEPVPGKTMPHFSIVERDYVNLVHRFNSLGPGSRNTE